MYEGPKQSLIDGPFEADWESLQGFRVPAWYRDAKFGIFIHWGVYSVPAFQDEWYPRKMYQQDDPAFEHHRKTWGEQKQFGYKDFVPMFTAPEFDAGEWVDVFKRAGAKYLVPVAEHHDGFAMYATKLNRWNAVEMGPRRDVVGELARETRAAGLHFGVSNHRAEHWWFMNGGRVFDSDIRNGAAPDFYDPASPMGQTPSTEFKEDYLARLKELADLYEPELYYFDTWAERPPLQPYLKHFAAHYYNRAAEWGREVAINYKNSCFAHGTGVIDVERGQLGAIRPYFWQSDTAIGQKSWCHIEGETYKSAATLIADLVDIVSKNGTLLLNVGPHADGSLGEQNVKVLTEIGEWLGRNGEAIYGTRPWKVFGEGPTRIPEGHFTDARREPFTPADIRFTRRGRTIYAVSLASPGERWLIRSFSRALQLLDGTIGTVRLLGDERPLTWEQRDDGLLVTLPAHTPPMPTIIIET